ncbi:alpha/beta fold hydrolase [bacterium]|nr:alpha/beta fold hydrolase [bacterium]
MMNRIDLIRPDAPELARLGPHRVGVRTLDLVNPGQMDVMAAMAGSPALYDRKIVVEVWYPARPGTGPDAGAVYPTLLRDGRTEVALHGLAQRDAQAEPGPFPLVILSHGYPGNRMLMSHLGENLASKGYVVASLDHADSTYGDPAYLGGAAFGSTLVNRSLDTKAVMEALPAPAVAIIGYSMGGYGALVAAGAAVAKAALQLQRAGSVGPWLDQHTRAKADPRLKAIVPIGPWGRQHGVWDAAGLAGLSVPALIIAGGRDEVSGYETGMRRIFAEATGVERHLLTFEAAGHNAGAPIPAPQESWTPVPWLDFVPFEHYADKVWDTVRMNNITQHFVTAFLDRHLKGDEDKARYLSADFAGFAPGTAIGLTWESLAPARP